MPVSTTISAVVVNLLATFLPLLGVRVATDEITIAVQVAVAVFTGIWIWVERVRRGDVNKLGVRIKKDENR